MTLRKFFIGRALVFTVLLVALAGFAGFKALNSYIYNQKQAPAAADYKKAAYTVRGEQVTLQYFGNEFRSDLNGDGREDITFLATRETNGKKEYYVVAALHTERGYVGSDGLFLGIDIAPQTTEKGREKIVIVNYAENSVGKSIWLYFDPQSMQFGEVQQNFEGEADPARMNLGMKKWRWVRSEYNDGSIRTPKKDVFTLTFYPNNTFGATTDCNSISGTYKTNGAVISFTDMVSTEMYCAESQEGDFRKMLDQTGEYLFTSKGELVLGIKYDSGSVIFR